MLLKIIVSFIGKRQKTFDESATKKQPETVECHINSPISAR